MSDFLEAHNMENYSWTKLYPDHCSDDVIEMMQAEDVHMRWDEIPEADDFCEALIELGNMDNRIWLYEEFKKLDAGIDESYLLEYLTVEGVDDIFRMMMNDYDEEFSHSLIIEIIQYGLEDSDLPGILTRYNGKFTGEEAEELFASCNIPDDCAQKIIREQIESLDQEQIEEIMNCIDEKLYPFMMPYIQKLPFETRVEIMDEFGIEYPKKRSKDEPSKTFERAAMAFAVAEGIRQGIKGEKGFFDL